MLASRASTRVQASKPFTRAALPPRIVCRARGPQTSSSPVQTAQQKSQDAQPQLSTLGLSAFQMSFGLYLLTEAPAMAEGVASNPFAGIQANSLYVTLALFLMSVPGKGEAAVPEHGRA